jgi:flagellar protein FliO/FliZ
LDTLFGDGSSGLKILIAVVVVLVLLALAVWLVRRFSGGRLGGGTARGRQPRLAVIDRTPVDGRRSLVLIRRDNVEHLLIIGGPTDVVVEQNILRAAAVQRDVVPARPAAATDTLPRAVPLGDDTLWPLQPEPAPKGEPALTSEPAPKPEPAFKPEPPPRIEPAPRLEPSLRGDGTPPPPRLPTTAEEPAPWQGEPETPEVPAPPAAAPPPIPSTAPAARERRPAALDPLAGLAEELSRLPSAAEPRRGPRLPPTPPASPAAPEAPATAPADQNLSEMAQRLEAALRRPPKPGERPPEPTPPVAPTGPEPDPFAPRPRSARMESPFRRPFRADDLRSATPAPRPAGEPGSAESEEGAPAPRFEPGLRRPFKADDLRSGAAAPKPADKPADEPGTGEAAEGASAPDPGAKPKSLYDSLEQEMASLLNRPTPKP